MAYMEVIGLYGDYMRNRVTVSREEDLGLRVGVLVA